MQNASESSTIGEMPSDLTDKPIFTQKLVAAIRLTGDTNSEISVKAGLHENAVSNMIAKGAIPRPETCVRIANIVGVPVGWLIDDKNESLVPPPADDPLMAAAEADLMREVTRRYLAEAKRMDEFMEEIEGTQWGLFALELYQHPLGQPFPDKFRRRIQLAEFAPLLPQETINRFTVGSGVPDKLKPDALLARWRRIMERFMSMHRVQAYLLNSRFANARPEMKPALQKEITDALPGIKAHAESGDALFETSEEVEKAGGRKAFLQAVIDEAKPLVEGTMKEWRDKAGPDAKISRRESDKIMVASLSKAMMNRIRSEVERELKAETFSILEAKKGKIDPLSATEEAAGKALERVEARLKVIFSR